MKVSIFLDSGAFSAWSKGEEISIYDYIKFIKHNRNYIHFYSNLDVIGDPEATWNNQKIMEKAGLNPIPVFHYGSDFFWLSKYISSYDYISLGGMVPISNSRLVSWLDFIFYEYICDKLTGIPRCKVHGFGMSSLSLMLRYPWYSVDSTSWIMAGSYGSVFVPRFRSGFSIYDENPWKVIVSSRSLVKIDLGDGHIDNYSPKKKSIILNYFNSKGFDLGESSFRFVDKNYRLTKGERWFGKVKKDGSRCVEKVIKLGLSNDYCQRFKLNAIYFMDLERHIQKWPWSFKLKTKIRGFNLI